MSKFSKPSSFFQLKDPFDRFLYLVKEYTLHIQKVDFLLGVFEEAEKLFPFCFSDDLEDFGSALSNEKFRRLRERVAWTILELMRKRNRYVDRLVIFEILPGVEEVNFSRAQKKIIKFANIMLFRGLRAVTKIVKRMEENKSFTSMTSFFPV
jgi:hypothetical protein